MRTEILCLFLLMLLPPKANAQDPYMDHATGLQLGYARYGYNQIEFGLNHYWSYARHFPSGDSGLVRSHTFGPFVSAAFVFNNGSGLYVAPKIGFNYAFPSILSGRISPSIEFVKGHGMYAGGDVGVSLLGIFLFYGHYVHSGTNPLPDFHLHRFGIRFIFNEAPINTSGAFI